jgi:uncharacterized protein (DUF2267 family)
MSANGLDVFDRTIQTTNLWLDEVMLDIVEDRQTAWRVLGVVMRKLRDRLPVDLAAHLGAELPLLVRGAYYDQFEPAKLPVRINSIEEFCLEVEILLHDGRPVDPRLAVGSVFALLSRQIAEGQVAELQHALPKSIHEFWIAASESLGSLPWESRHDESGGEAHH